MKIRLITLLLGLGLFQSTHAQQVSTLVTDTDKQFAAMHWHEDGRIYAVDYYNGRLYQVFLDGTVETILSGFSALAGGGFDSDGTFYIASINTGDMLRLNSDNTYESVASGFNQPVTLIQSSSDNDQFFVSEYGNDKVSTFSMSTGEVSEFVVENGVNGPDGVIYDWTGDLLVANWDNHKIHRISADGTVSLFANVPAIGNMGYITIVGDYLYVPSVSGRKLFRLDMEGNATLIAGTGTLGSADGPGAEASFLGPNGICHSPNGDTLLVSDGPTLRIITDFEPSSSISIEESTGKINLSPNPSSNLLHIEFDNPLFSQIDWYISDQQGKVILSDKKIHLPKDKSTLELHITDLIPGMYTLQITSESGQKSQHSFIKYD